MKSTITTTIVVTLVLSKDEAGWLHTVMQNPLHDQNPHRESDVDRGMRQKFWEATKQEIPS